MSVKYELTDHLEMFKASLKNKINYSETAIPSSYQIVPQGLLFEAEINLNKPQFSLLYELPVIYEESIGDLKFDIFSAVFWFISRYEEYQEFKSDKHGRFPAVESLLFQNDLLEKPVVDIWINYFSEQLTNKFPALNLGKEHFSYLTTIDIDSPWCYKNKGAYRNIGGLVRDGIKFNLKALKLRIRVLLGLIPDPWYKFVWLETLENKYQIKFKYFIHVGNHSSYDKTVSYDSRAFKKFIDSINNHERIALHPSYKAHNNHLQFKEEIMRLAALTKQDITESRQHFLVFQVHHYYTMLQKLNIFNDYSMGFADKAGFRAGTSNSFYFFDLKNNTETKLMIHPFVVMDRTLNSYENKNPEQALLEIKKLVDTVKETNGTFICLWHNESLSDKFEWEGWQNIFEKTQQYLVN